MKYIFKNKYLLINKFGSSKEALDYFNNTDVRKKISLEESYGEYYYCLICYNSLTKEKIFAIKFSADENEIDLSVLFCDELLFVMSTGKNIYLIDEELKITTCIEITTPLMGLYLTKGNNLIILEETSCKLIDMKGGIIKEKMFDLIENYRIEDTKLYIHTSDKCEVFEVS